MSPRPIRFLSMVMIIGLATASGVLFVRSGEVRLTPRSFGWRFLVRGGDPVRERAVVLLPGIERHEPRSILLGGADEDTGVNVRIAVDRRALGVIRVTRRQNSVIVLPSAQAPGARLDLLPSSSMRISSLVLRGVNELPLMSCLLALFLVIGMTAYLGLSMSARAAAALGLAFGAMLVAAHTPALVILAFPVSPQRALIAPLLALIAVALALSLKRSRRERRLVCQGAALLGALVFGAWVRGAFLPSAGSWDTEYWKAWTLRAVDAGLTRVYGDRDSVPPGQFWAQLNGDAPRYEVSYEGRDFPVDYPPLAMTLWSLSYRLVTRYATGLNAAEARNVAVKLPAVIGDVAALVAILWVLRRRPRRALVLAIIYWALPVSWLSSAVLGYSDATYAPLSVIALFAAGGGAPIIAGIALATACLIKPTAGIIAPAVFAGLIRHRGASWRAALTVALIGLAALLPYLASGTLSTTVIHLYRIFQQRTLSGGFPNPWWLIGHLLTHGSGAAHWAGPAQHASVDLIPSARVWGLALFLLAVVAILLRTRRLASPVGEMIAGGLLVFSYGLCAVGVHENHPHALFLILLATGLLMRSQRLFFAGISLTYVLTMLSLSGIGRFYGTRYIALDPLIDLVFATRMALGIDLTLLLVPFHVSLLAVALAYREGWGGSR